MSAGRIRRWWLLVPGIAGQVAADHLSSGYLSQSALVGSYALLALFLWSNRLLVGVGLLAAGLTANAVVTIVDTGMPVRSSAMVAAGLAGPGGAAVAPQGARHHLEGSSDQLIFLDDHLPVRPLRRVVSYGDVVLLVGAVDVLGRLALAGVRPRARAGARVRLTPGAAPTPRSPLPGARPGRPAPRPVVRTA